MSGRSVSVMPAWFAPDDRPPLRPPRPAHQESCRDVISDVRPGHGSEPAEAHRIPPQAGRGYRECGRHGSAHHDLAMPEAVNT
jgi:hypothetical protein